MMGIFSISSFYGDEPKANELQIALSVGDNSG